MATLDDSPDRTPLFRKQVVEHRQQRLYGNIVLSGSRASSFLVVAIAIVGISMVLWAASATYPRTTQVVGVVVTSHPSAKMYAARSGTIEHLYVSDGMSVKKGQPIAVISVEIRDRTQRSSATESMASLTRQEGLIDAQLEAGGRATNAEKSRLRLLLTANITEQKSLDNQLSIQSAIVATMQGSLERISPIAEKGFISKFEVERRQQALLAERQRIEQMNQQRVQLQSRAVDLTAQLSRTPIEQNLKSAELQGQRQALSQQEFRTSIEVAYTIVAPIDGRITALQAAVGRSVDPRIPLMTLVPEMSTFEAEVFAPSRAAGFIRDGQNVRIMYDAFPYKQFGSFVGRVVGVSRTAFLPNELDVPIKLEEAVYRVRVRLSSQTVEAYGRKLPLQSGMTLSANIILERRSFADWLLEPLNAVRKRT